MAFTTLDDVEVTGKRVLLRVDINSPVDPDTKTIADDNRIVRSLPTIRELADRGARLVMIAHQGDTLGDAEEKLLQAVEYRRYLRQDRVEDVCHRGEGDDRAGTRDRAGSRGSSAVAASAVAASGGAVVPPAGRPSPPRRIGLARTRRFTNASLQT